MNHVDQASKELQEAIVIVKAFNGQADPDTPKHIKLAADRFREMQAAARQILEEMDAEIDSKKAKINADIKAKIKAKHGVDIDPDFKLSVGDLRPGGSYTNLAGLRDAEVGLNEEEKAVLSLHVSLSDAVFELTSDLLRDHSKKLVANDIKSEPDRSYRGETILDLGQRIFRRDPLSRIRHITWSMNGRPDLEDPTANYWTKEDSDTGRQWASEVRENLRVAIERNTRTALMNAMKATQA
jgi:hypothetical protein